MNEKTLSLQSAMAIYESKGGKFFSPKAMKFWRSRILAGFYNGEYFVTSELLYDGSCRVFSVRKFTNDFSHVETIGGWHSTKAKAVAVIKAII